MAVAHLNADIAVSHPLQALARPPRQLGDDLQRIDLLHQLGEHRRLVAAAGAHLQHRTALRWQHQVAHQGDDEVLGNGVVAPDGQRAVAEGQWTHVALYEPLPRHPMTRASRASLPIRPRVKHSFDSMSRSMRLVPDLNRSMT